MKEEGTTHRRNARALLAICVGTALSLAGDATLYAVLPAHTVIAGIGVLQLGLVLSANRLVRIFTNTPAGFLYDRFGHRRLYLAGLWLGVLPSVGYAIGRGLGLLLASRILWGVCWSLILVGGYAIILEITTSETRGSATGTFQMAYFAGGGLGMLFGGVLTDLLGYRPAFWACAVVSLVGAVAVTALLPETSRRSRHEEWDSASVAGVLRAGADEMATVVPWLVRQWNGIRAEGPSGVGWTSPLVIGSFANFAVYFVTNGVLMSTLAYFLQCNMGDRVMIGAVAVGISTVSGTLLASRSAFSIVLAPLAGRLSDRLVDRRVIVLVGMVLLLVGFLLLASPANQGLWGVAGAVAVVAIGGGLVAPTLTSWVADRSEGPKQSTAMGVYATAADVGSAAGPLVAYAIAAGVGLPATYALCAAVLVVAVVALMASRQG